MMKIKTGGGDINTSQGAKRYFDKLDIDEAKESDFVEQVVYPFLAKDREDALEYVRQQTG